MLSESSRHRRPPDRAGQQPRASSEARTLFQNGNLPLRDIVCVLQASTIALRGSVPTIGLKQMVPRAAHRVCGVKSGAHSTLGAMYNAPRNTLTGQEIVCRASCSITR
jgi:hypothetical protein